MSSSPPPFIALAIEGRVEPARIDDFVDRWHEEQGEEELHDYLGLTSAEYAFWLVEPDALGAIIRARAEAIPLSVMVSDMLAHRSDNSVPADLAWRERLERWLAEAAARD